MSSIRKQPLKNWNEDKAFGFVFIRGVRVFVHIHALQGVPEGKKNLNGVFITFDPDHVVETSRWLYDQKTETKILTKVKELSAALVVAA